jgi:hypothetical protein
MPHNFLNKIVANQVRSTPSLFLQIVKATPAIFMLFFCILCFNVVLNSGSLDGEVTSPLAANVLHGGDTAQANLHNVYFYKPYAGGDVYLPDPKSDDEILSIGYPRLVQSQVQYSINIRGKIWRPDTGSGSAQNINGFNFELYPTSLILSNDSNALFISKYKGWLQIR